MYAWSQNNWLPRAKHKKALTTGQDCAYLAEFLLAKGFEVHAIKRRPSSLRRIKQIGNLPNCLRAIVSEALT